ncbi:unnamed protein product [Closterium sp. NIES-53]
MCSTCLKSASRLSHPLLPSFPTVLSASRCPHLTVPSPLFVPSCRLVVPSPLYVLSCRPFEPSPLAIPPAVPLPIRYFCPLFPSPIVVPYCRPLLPFPIAFPSYLPRLPSLLAVPSCRPIRQSLSRPPLTSPLPDPHRAIWIYNLPLAPQYTVRQAHLALSSPLTRWIYNPRPAPQYTAESCTSLGRNLACQRNGRPDSEYEKYTWRSFGCTIAE